ncbi:MAG TPA: hypothetical protein VN455_03965 [Methanotrichaceae archaeon]|nr:hypothetical protein [Methanotrichaceae archaeon]
MSPSNYLRVGSIAFILAYMLALGASAQPVDAQPAAAQPAQDQVTLLDPLVERGNRIVPSNLSIDSSAFTNAGCSFEGGRLDCSIAGLDQQFNCSSIYNASNDLGGLSPKLPIAECLFQGSDYASSPDEGIVRTGCLIPFYRRYIVRLDGEFRSISTKEEFISLFAPVETPQEALSFAVALTNSFSKYDASRPQSYFPVVKYIEPTYVEDEKNGAYKVHLFQSEYCGCGTHPIYAVDYLVTRDGNVTEADRQKVFDSSNDICID